MDTIRKSSVLKIVTVEDSLIVVERIQSMLLEIGNVEFSGNAKNIASATALIDHHQPDAVIIDINLEEDMPKSSGINLLIELRAKYSDMVLIMFTNLAEQQYRNTCMVIGANYFFDKSNDFEKIPGVIREMIGQKTAKHTS